MTIFQVPSQSTRVGAARIVASRLPMTRPAVTAARTPESPSRSAGRYAANGMTSEMTTSTGGSSRRRRSATASAPTTTPIAIPPIAATTKPLTASASTNAPLAVATTAVRYATNAVASLNSDSPSTSATMRLGTGIRRKTVVAARASVGPTIAPNANAGAQSSPTTKCMTTATTTVVSSTSTTDSRAIGQTSVLRSRIGDSMAAANSSGGRNTSSTSSGSSRIAGHARHEPERQPADHEQARPGHADPPRHLEQQRDRHRDREDRAQGIHAGDTIRNVRLVQFVSRRVRICRAWKL